VTDYEILLMLDPDLAEEKQAEVVQRTRALIEQGGGAFERHDVWGRRKLAYEIDHRDEGAYHLLTFTATPETLDEISRVLKIDDAVIRHLATRRPEGGPTGPVAAPAPIGDDTRAEPADAPEEEYPMAAINRVVLVGNLTKDPELRHTPSGTAVCNLRLAVNTRRKDETGQWVDKPNYFDVTVWGNQGERCAQYLAKGRPVGVDGRLEWREWESQDGGKRQAVEIVADTVQFLGGRDSGGEGGGTYLPAQGGGQQPDADFPASASDDDIPF
jgi:single-strand DNA-binding protein